LQWRCLRFCETERRHRDYFAGQALTVLDIVHSGEQVQRQLVAFASRSKTAWRRHDAKRVFDRIKITGVPDLE
jgi:hypothetical protein